MWRTLSVQLSHLLYLPFCSRHQGMHFCLSLATLPFAAACELRVSLPGAQGHRGEPIRVLEWRGLQHTFQVKIGYVLRCWNEKHVNTAEECWRRTTRVQHLLQNMSTHARQWWRRRKRKNDLLQDRQRGASASGIHTTSACCV